MLSSIQRFRRVDTVYVAIDGKYITVVFRSDLTRGVDVAVVRQRRFIIPVDDGNWTRRVLLLFITSFLREGITLVPLVRTEKRKMFSRF